MPNPAKLTDVVRDLAFVARHIRSNTVMSGSGEVAVVCEPSVGWQVSVWPRSAWWFGAPADALWVGGVCPVQVD